MKPVALLVAVVVLGGCSASSINTAAPEASVYAPANEPKASGEVSYLNAGAKKVRDARRADAYKKMHDHCGGAYDILKEEDQRSPWGIQRRIWFRCADAQEGSGT